MDRESAEKFLIKLNIDFWYPDSITYPNKKTIQTDMKRFDQVKNRLSSKQI